MIRILCVVALVLHACAAVCLAGKDFYAVLGLPKDTTVRAIKKTFRKLSMQYHPDKNPGNQEAHDKFVELTEAYNVLGDPEKRRKYDLYGEEGLEGGGGGGGPNPFDIFSSFFGGGDDFFFGGGGGGHSHHAEHRGPTIHIDLDVSLADLYNGVEIDVDVSRWHLCPKCRGTGAASAEAVHTCTACSGTGVRLVRQMLAPGMYTQMQMQCDVCGGKGKTITENCPVCSSKKIVRGNRQLIVNVERGMKDGEEIIFERIGDEGPEQGAGDVVFRVRLADPHPLFYKRSGDNLMMQMTISLIEAMTGFERRITHLDGREVVIARSGVTPAGFIQELQHEGMPQHKFPSEKGSLYIRYNVDFPREFSEAQKAALKELFKDVTGDKAATSDAAAGGPWEDDHAQHEQQRHWTEDEAAGHDEL